MEMRNNEIISNGPPAGVAGILAEAIFPAYGLVAACCGTGTSISGSEDEVLEELAFVTEIVSVSFVRHSLQASAPKNYILFRASCLFPERSVFYKVESRLNQNRNWNSIRVQTTRPHHLREESMRKKFSTRKPFPVTSLTISHTGRLSFPLEDCVYSVVLCREPPCDDPPLLLFDPLDVPPEVVGSTRVIPRVLPRISVLSTSFA